MSRSGFTVPAAGVLISDGGLATELEARGHDLSDDLWSARLLAEAPAEIVAVHELRRHVVGQFTALLSRRSRGMTSVDPTQTTTDEASVRRHHVDDVTGDEIATHLDHTGVQE